MRYWKAPMVTLHSHPRLIAEHLFCMIDWEIWVVMQNTHWVTSAIATRILRLTHINLQEELYLHLGHSDARMQDGDQTASMNMFKQGQPWYHCPALIRLLRQCWLGVYPIQCINEVRPASSCFRQLISMHAWFGKAIFSLSTLFFWNSLSAWRLDGLSKYRYTWEISVLTLMFVLFWAVWFVFKNDVYSCDSSAVCIGILLSGIKKRNWNQAQPLRVLERVRLCRYRTTHTYTLVLEHAVSAWQGRIEQP